MIDKLLGGYGTLILYGLAAAAIAAVLAFTYHEGYSRAASKWETQYAKREAEIAEQMRAEVSRVSQANAMAKAVEQKRVTELAALNERLETKIKELSDEADADPDRDRACLSDGSRVRIDSVH